MVFVDSLDDEAPLSQDTSGGVPRRVVDAPTFTIAAAARGWRVHITWSDGEEGPAIVLASRQEAEKWIERDSHDWLVRLSAVTPARWD